MNIINGDSADNILNGTVDDDVINGADGDDTLNGLGGNDELNGGPGDDVLDGGSGDDQLFGGDGNDTLITADGNDLLVGGVGDDTFVIASGGTGDIVIEDNLGSDTLDLSALASGATIDLTLATSSVADGRSITFQNVLSQALDVFFLQDLSGSFSDDISTVRPLVPDIANAIQDLQVDSLFGAGSFVDIPIGPFGSSGDFVYETNLSLTSDVDTLQDVFDGLVIEFGADFPEAQLTALLQSAVRTDEIGYRSDATRIVILFTDATFHQAGDASFLAPNNGDGVLDGDPPGTGEDFPSIPQVGEALFDAGIIPVFAVTSSVSSTYEQLVSDLGVGAVVNLTSNSSNVVEAVQNAILSGTMTSIENVIGTAFDDIITGTLVANRVEAGAGNDDVFAGNGADIIFGDAGDDIIRGAGDDVLNGGSAIDLLSGGLGNDTLNGDGGQDALSGDEGDDRLFGGRGGDTLDGGAGNDQLNGGEGFDVLTGGAGADLFIFSDISFQNDRLTDFEDGVDLIVFRASTGVTSFSDLLVIRQAGADVVIETVAGNVRIENFNVGDVDMSDFMFG